MRLLTAVVLDEVTDTVKKELLRLGVLDFIQVSRLAPEQAARLSVQKQQEEPGTYTNLRSRVETLFMQAGMSTPSSEKLNPDTMQPLEIGKAKAMVDNVVGDLTTIREQQKQLSQSRIRVDELLRYINEGKLQYLDIRIGQVGKGNEALIRSRLANQAFVLIQPASWKDFVLLTLKRDRQQVSPLIETLQRITTRIKEDMESLETLWCDLRLHELLGNIARNFSHTRNTTIFSGWVPTSESSTLETVIRSASNGACVIEWTDAKYLPREEVPVAVEDIPFLRPFQKLVDNYSVPEYGTINPTPFVAISYLVMFGLMFADAGQGLVILLIGLLGLKYSQHDQQLKPPMISTDMYRLFIYLGIASVVSGILFGSYFGFALFPPVWFDYHAAVVGHETTGRNVYSILTITIWFGIVVIGLGLILNWINLIRKRDWFHLIMDKNGMIGGWVFGCGIWAAFAFVGSGYKQLPQGMFLPIAFGLPLALLFAKVPLHRYVERRHGKDLEPKRIGSLVMEAVLEWIVDVLEIFSGFLANTLSFMRVAGLGIAHVSLMTAFAQMAELAGGGVAGILVLVVGNVMVIALEGLSAGIQALRLNYYEFFTKYFTGRGLSYNPIALHPHAGRKIISRP
jgi:V/A-type H+-transporting ATPase subunit I